MKKLTALFMSFMLLFSLAACGSNGQTQSNTESASSDSVSEVTTEPETKEPEVTENPSADTPDTEETPAENTDGKTLVVYYSASGNTEEVANYIAEAMGADLFELEPTEIYSDADLDWTDRDSRVSREHDNPDERAVPLVADTVENWDSYDTVFIGYPIWWGIAAWPVDGFIAANDFTGKTVIPFCTSSSSGLGESGELLEEAAGTGEWLEGIRFRSGVSEETVTEWVDSLGLK